MNTLSAYSNGILVVVGDFISVMCNELNVISDGICSSKEVIQFRHAITELNWSDLWRNFPEEEREYTGCRFHPFVARRFDYCFVSDSVA